MKPKIKATIVLVLGILFLLLGLASALVPIVPGWLFVLIGLLLLSFYSPRLRARIDTHTEKWPKAHKLIHRLRVWIDRQIGEF